MRVVEFKTKLKNNRIQIPKKLHKQVNTSKNKDVRVIVLMDEQNQKDDFQLLSKEQFLKGYTKTDSVYDHY
jgi:protein-tyrosine-phosphatase